MRSTIESIKVSIDRAEGQQLRTQILALFGEAGSIGLYSKEMRGTPLANLFELLNESFESSRVRQT